MIYIYKHPDREEYVEVFQRMNDEHVYFDGDGLQWERQYTAPNAGVDTKADPFSKKDFIRATENKKGTYGDILDLSKEMAQRRADKDGVDVVKQKYLDQYARERGGRRHPSEKPRKFENKYVAAEL